MNRVVVKGPEDLGWLKGISSPEKECSIWISYLDRKAYIWVVINVLSGVLKGHG